MSHISPFGSYNFGSFQSNDRELTRLERQATVAWPIERARLLEVGLKPDMRILDLACGPGFISRLIAAELGPEGEVVGIDLNDGLLEIAAATAAEWNALPERSNLSFYKADAYRLDLPDDSFDLVYARFLFQHLARPLDAMAEIRRALKPGGRLLIADVDDAVFNILPELPGLTPMMEIAAAAQSERGGDRRIGRKLPHYLKRAGFEDVTTDIEVISSDDIGLEAFIEITSRFKIELLPERHRATAQRVFDGIRSDRLDPSTYAHAGVYAVSGRVPTHPL